MRCIIYIMRRTQLYLNDDLWETLHIESKQRGTTVSELVREAVRDKYGNSPTNRAKAMEAVIGMWKDRTDLPDSETYIRQLRKGKRLERIRS